MDSNNKRIAKNTMMLYVRMLFIMVVTLYTSRIILNILGVEDYGIYTVIGGIVALFSVFSSSLSAAISRFITYELGKGDEGDLKKIFSTAVIIQIALAIFICLLMEIGGVWFLNNRMNIPVDVLEQLIGFYNLLFLHLWLILSVYHIMLLLLHMKE